MPSPVYPLLQVQLNDPMVLLQVADEWQVWALIVHSSTSADKSNKISQALDTIVKVEVSNCDFSE